MLKALYSIKRCHKAPATATVKHTNSNKITKLFPMTEKHLKSMKTMNGMRLELRITAVVYHFQYNLMQVSIPVTKNARSKA